MNSAQESKNQNIFNFSQKKKKKKKIMKRKVHEPDISINVETLAPHTNIDNRSKKDCAHGERKIWINQKRHEKSAKS